MIFMVIDRRWGRGVKLTLALFLLGCATAGIAFMPDYSGAGVYAIMILATMRIAQGIALGGTWNGLSSLLAMNAPENQRGWYAMLPQLGAPVGLFVASALFIYLVAGLSEADFLQWGWRYPFFVAFAINVVALFARLRIVVTPEYREPFESLELQPTGLRETLSAEGVNILLGAFTPLATFALFHMVTVFPLSWVYLTAEQDLTAFLGIEIGTSVIGLAAIVASGAIADRIGRRRLLIICAVAIAVFALMAPVLLDGGQIGEFVYMVVGFGAARLLLRAVLRRGRLALRPALPLHRLGPDLRPRLDVRGRVRAAGGAAPARRTSGWPPPGAYLLSGAVCSTIALFLSQHLDLRND